MTIFLKSNYFYDVKVHHLNRLPYKRIEKSLELMSYGFSPVHPFNYESLKWEMAKNMQNLRISLDNQRRQNRQKQQNTTHAENLV